MGASSLKGQTQVQPGLIGGGNVTEYTEIEDTKELARLNADLAKRLRSHLKHTEDREIGYPAGRFSARVYFQRSRGESVFWWSPGTPSGHNYFGHAKPGDNSWLNIEVQFNVSFPKFSRMSGGSFLRHVATQRVVLAHRGIVTVGHGRVNKVKLFAEVSATTCVADTSGGTREFLFISELETGSLVNDIAAFAIALRRAVKKIQQSDAHNKTLRTVRGSSAKVSSQLGKLGRYFDEFIGKMKLKGRKPTIADCYHGTVVRELRDQLESSFEILKSRVVDLVAYKGRQSIIFEVKTSSNTQDVYTAVGQISFHSAAVARFLGCSSLKRVVVLPENPPDQLHSVLTETLEMQVLTYNRSNDGGITFRDLKQLIAENDS